MILIILLKKVVEIEDNFSNIELKFFPSKIIRNFNNCFIIFRKIQVTKQRIHSTYIEFVFEMSLFMNLHILNLFLASASIIQINITEALLKKYFENLVN